MNLRIKIFISILILFTITGCYLDLDNPHYLASNYIDLSHILFRLNLIDFDTTYDFTQWEYGVISTIFFTYAVFKGQNSQKWILIIEILITLIRYFFTKDGYIVGFGGGANTNVVLYDFFAFSLRILLLLIVFNYPSKSLFLKIVISIVSAIIIIKIKMLFFRI